MSDYEQEMATINILTQNAGVCAAHGVKTQDAVCIDVGVQMLAEAADRVNRLRLMFEHMGEC